MKKAPLIVLIIIVTLIIVAIFFYIFFNKNKNIQNLESKIESWQVYTDSQYGYEVKYLTDWSYVNTPNTNTLFYRDGHNKANDQCLFIITPILNSSANKSIIFGPIIKKLGGKIDDSNFEEFLNESTPGQIEFININGIPAYKVKFLSDDGLYYIIHPDYIFQLNEINNVLFNSAKDYLEAMCRNDLEKILFTFKFTK